MLKQTTVIVALALTSFAAWSSTYFVVVPVPNKLVSRTAIDVALAGYALPAALIGTPYEGFNLSRLLSVTGDPGYTGYGVRWELVSGSLPAGLSFGKDGAITGTPTAAGTASFQVRATYKTKSGQQAYQLVVANLTVGLATGTPPQALVGQGYSYDLKPRLTVSGDSAYTGAGVTWSVVDSTLPAGLYLTADGFIGGTPTAAGSGSLTARASYKGVNGEQTYQVVSLKVAVALATATPPEAYVGRAYSYDLKSRLSVTGDPGFDGSGVTWGLVDSNLPAGLYLTADGVISGTPTAAGTGTVTVLATYKNAQGEQAYQVVSLKLQVALATSTPPEAYVGQGYSYDLKPLLTVSGDSAYTGAGVTWSVVDSTLPAGLYLTADGFIGGTPTAAGTGNVTARASYKGVNGEQAYQVVVLTIEVGLASATLPAGVQNIAYRFDLKPQLTISGDPNYSNGTGVTWSVVTGSLPAGLSLGADGVITGTPTAENTGIPFTVKATYKTNSGQQGYAITVGAITVTLASATPPAAQVGTPYNNGAGWDLRTQVTITGDGAYAGNGEGVTWSMASGVLPPGMSLNATTGVISGTPTQSGTGAFTVKADYQGKSAAQSYTIPLTGGITQYTGFRAWSDGAYAASCKEYRNGKAGFAYSGATGDGVYRIAVAGYAPVDVVCDMTNDGGGWTVFQRRTNGAVNFYRTYAEYAAGFGSATTEYWLGNDRVAAMTAGGAALRVDMQRYTGQTAYAQYTSFKINPASDAYRLTVSGYSGTAGDSLGNTGNTAKGMRFTTKDVDYDASATNCAVTYKGAWWYNACHYSNLNGYYYGGPHTSYADGVEWNTWTGYHDSLTKTEMKVR